MTYQVENRHLHHTLVEVRRAVLDNLDSHDLLRLKILTLDDLAKRALAEHIQDQVSVPSERSAPFRYICSADDGLLVASFLGP